MRNLHPAIKRVIDAQCISLTQAATLVRTEFNDIEFSLRGIDRNIWQHEVWQKLFTIYRAFGCPVDDMHDMLCDFNNIQRLFREDFKYEFYWYFDPGYRFTVFDIRERWDEEFGIHIAGTEDGEFKMRHLFNVQKSEVDATDHAGS